MKKDIEWLKKEIGNMPYTKLKRVGMEHYVAISKSGVFELINQLDEPEVLSTDWIKNNQRMWASAHGVEYYVLANKLYGKIVPKQNEPETLSQEWIDDHTDKFVGNEGLRFVSTNDLQNLLVPEQELPMIPEFVAEWIEFKKKSEVSYENVFQAIDELVKSSTSKAHDWVLKTSENKDAFARAWLDGFTVEERELTVKGVIEEHIELLKKQEVAVNLKPYYDLWEELKDE